MGLLRACADAVLIGSGTLHASPQTQWTAEHAYPPAAELYDALRRRRSVPPLPTLAVLSGSGKIDGSHPAFAQPAIVVTSKNGARNLLGILPATAEIASIGDDAHIGIPAAVRALRDRGHQLVLCEGGPTLLGALVSSEILDELFLTVSPRLAGRGASDERLSLIENAGLLPNRLLDGRLLSVRKAGSHLFLRYRLRGQ